MSKCRQCRVEILDETERCPLCGSVLEPTIEVENMYPDVRVKARKLMFLSRIYLFLIIVVEAFLININYFTDSTVWWSLITGLALLYSYMVIRFAILGKAGYRTKTVILTALAILMVVAIDFLVGYHGWSVNYVLPSGIILIDIGIIFLMIFNRRNWQSYLMWQIFMILCSIIPIILWLVGVVTEPLAAGTAFLLSLFLFLGTVIIGDRRARVELKRRFHIR